MSGIDMEKIFYKTEFDSRSYYEIKGAWPDDLSSEIHLEHLAELAAEHIYSNLGFMDVDDLPMIITLHESEGGPVVATLRVDIDLTPTFGATIIGDEWKKNNE